MKGYLRIIVVCCFVLNLGIAGCAQGKASSSSEAIKTSESMGTKEQKAEYLINQAKAFYNSEKFQGAVDIAQYILKYVDKNSQEAKSLLEKAKEALIAKAKEAASTVKENVSKKLGSFGK